MDHINKGKIELAAKDMMIAMFLWKNSQLSLRLKAFLMDNLLLIMKRQQNHKRLNFLD
jgi:hypothetical protein